MARRRLLIFLALWASVATAFLLDGNVEGNELDTLALAKERIDPTFVVGDFRLSLPPGPRLAFQILLEPLLRTMPLLGVSIVGRLLLYALLAGGLARIAARIGLDVFEALIAAALFVSMGQGLAAGEFVIGGLEGKGLAYACVFWGLDAFLGQAWPLSALWFGIALTIHPLVGAWSALALVATALTCRTTISGRRIALAIGVLLVAASPGLLSAWSALGSHAPSGVDAAWIYVRFRHPHHLEPRWFLLGHPVSLAWFAVATTAAVAATAVGLPTGQQRAVGRFAQMTLAVYWLGITVAALPHVERFLALYPFRVGDTLFPLFAIALAVASVSTRAPARLTRIGKPLGAGAAVLLAAVALMREVRATAERQREPVRRAYAWISAHTERESLVLCSPALHYAGVHMRRATVASARAIPTADADVAEWFRRVVDLNGGRLPRERGLAAFEELDAGFSALSAEQYRALATEYRAQYLLLRQGRKLPFAIEYDDGVWVVYRLDFDRQDAKTPVDG
jgi:hypothetical protein